jgi:hypothetical protein
VAQAITTLFQRARRRIETDYWDPASNPDRLAHRRERARIRETRRQLERQLAHSENPIDRLELEGILARLPQSDVIDVRAGLAGRSSLDEVEPGGSGWLKSA